MDTPWKLAARADFTHPGVTGSRTLTTGIVNWYVGHVRKAITGDEEVCRVFTFVTGLLAPPSALFHPKVVLRVSRHSLTRRTKSVIPLVPGKELPAEAAYQTPSK